MGHGKRPGWAGGSQGGEDDVRRRADPEPATFRDLDDSGPVSPGPRPYRPAASAFPESGAPGAHLDTHGDVLRDRDLSSKIDDRCELTRPGLECRCPQVAHE